jgi:hypothetical protein
MLADDSNTLRGVSGVGDGRRCCRPVAVGMPVRTGSSLIDVLGPAQCFSSQRSTSTSASYSRDNDDGFDGDDGDERLVLTISRPMSGSGELGCGEARYVAAQCYTAAAHLGEAATAPQQQQSSSILGDQREHLEATDPLLSSPFLANDATADGDEEDDDEQQSPVFDTAFMGSGDIVVSNTPRDDPNPIVKNEAGVFQWSTTKRIRITRMIQYLLSHAEPWSTGKSLLRIINAMRYAGLTSTFPSQDRACNKMKESPIVTQFDPPLCYFFWCAYAKDSGPYLVAAGFESIATDWFLSNAIMGDIVVFPSMSVYNPVAKTFRNYPKGHIAMKFVNSSYGASSGGGDGDGETTTTVGGSGWLKRPDWVSDFLHSKNVYEHVYDSVQSYEVPKLYRLRDDAQVPPSLDEEIIPVLGVERLVGNPLVWGQRWASLDAFETPLGEIMETVGDSWRCPSIISNVPNNNSSSKISLSNIIPQELTRMEALPLEIAKVAAKCFEMLPSGSSRRFGVRCCYDNKGLYVVQYPSQVTYLPADSAASAVVRATNAEAVLCLEHGIYSAPCAVYRSRRPAPPATNTPFSSPMKWTPALRMSAVYGDPHCTSYDSVDFECAFEGELVWTQCGNWSVHLVGKRPVEDPVNATPGIERKRKESTVINRVAVRYFTDTAIVMLHSPKTSSATSSAGGSEVFSEMSFARVFLNGMPVAQPYGAASDVMDVAVSNVTVTITDVAGNVVRVRVFSGSLGLTSSTSAECAADPGLTGLAVTSSKMRMERLAALRARQQQPDVDNTSNNASRTHMANFTTSLSQSAADLLSASGSSSPASSFSSSLDSTVTHSSKRTASSSSSGSFSFAAKRETTMALSSPSESVSQSRVFNDSNIRERKAATATAKATAMITATASLSSSPTAFITRTEASQRRALNSTSSIHESEQSNNERSISPFDIILVARGNPSVTVSERAASVNHLAVYMDIILSYLVESIEETLFPPPLFLHANYSFFPKFMNASHLVLYNESGSNSTTNSTRNATKNCSTPTAGAMSGGQTTTSFSTGGCESGRADGRFECPQACRDSITCCYDAMMSSSVDESVEAYAQWTEWLLQVRLPYLKKVARGSSSNDSSSFQLPDFDGSQVAEGPVFVRSRAAFSITLDSIRRGTNFSYVVQDNTSALTDLGCSVCGNPKVAACKVTHDRRANTSVLFLRLVDVHPMTIHCIARNAMNQTSVATTTIFAPLSVDVFSTPAPTRAPSGVVVGPPGGGGGGAVGGTYPPLWTPSPAAAAGKSTGILSLVFIVVVCLAGVLA